MSRRAPAVGALLAIGAACSLVDVGPHYLDVLAVAGDGLMLGLAFRLHRRAGPLTRRPWVPLMRLVGVLLLHVNPFVGAFTVLMAGVPFARAHTHGDFEVSATQCRPGRSPAKLATTVPTPRTSVSSSWPRARGERRLDASSRCLAG